MHRQTLIVIAFALVTQGCTSIASTLTPPPVDDQFIELGMERSEVESILNANEAELQFHGGTLVEYRYEDQDLWEDRTVLYAATGPADLFFAPLEWLLQRGNQRFARAIFDIEDHLVHFVVSYLDGEPAIELGGSRESLEPKPRSHTFLAAVLGSGHRFVTEDDADQDDPEVED